eukprot:2154148-Pyramimonas_sp.AAC.1
MENIFICVYLFVCPGAPSSWTVLGASLGPPQKPSWSRLGAIAGRLGGTWLRPGGPGGLPRPSR